jgi:hypothetical protein
MPSRRRTLTPWPSPLFAAGLLACLPGCQGLAHARSLRGSHRLTYDASSSISCSRSFATTRTQGTLQLTIGRSRATLTLDDIERYRFGDARDRYLPLGPRPSKVQHRRLRHQLTWQGTATRHARGVVILALRLKSSACTLLPRGRAYRFRPARSVTLRCQHAQVQAYPPVAKGGYGAMAGKAEKRRPVRVLRCTSKALPRSLEPTRHHGALLFATGTGITLYSQTGGYLGHRTRVLLRR